MVGPTVFRIKWVKRHFSKKGWGTGDWHNKKGIFGKRVEQECGWDAIPHSYLYQFKNGGQCKGYTGINGKWYGSQ